jgi:hypothetical protein
MITERGTAGGVLVDLGEVELSRRHDLEVVVVVDPPGLYPEAAQHLEQPVDLLDARDASQGGAAPVQQRGAQQCNAGVLGRLDVDAARQRGRSVDSQMHGPGTEGDDLGVESRTDACQHLEGEVLVAPSRCG